MIVVYQGTANLTEKSLALRLGVQLVSEAELENSASSYYLQYLPDGLSLCENGIRVASPTRVDFFDKALNKRVSDSIRNQNLIKALGIKKNPRPLVLDAMAGLGKDAFLMASVGCTVNMLEKSCVVYELLQDGLDRLRDSFINEDEKALTLQQADFLACNYENNAFDVVYLDPMYPLASRKSKAKKDMDRLHDLLGFEDVDDALLDKAKAIARRRVIVKRPKQAAAFAAQNPDISYPGSSARFDVYLSN